MRGRLWLVAGLGFASVLARAGSARAEVTISKPADGWEIYTSGRVGAFVEVLEGDGVPQSYANVNGVKTPIHPVGDGGVNAASDPVIDPVDGSRSNGRLLASRARSGFLGNILTFGVRRQLTESTTVSGQISIWATAETDSRRTFLKNLTDEREGFLRVDGPGGTLTLGRALSLFSRGATEIDFLYGHGYAVGSPAGFDDFGPAGGHIGYGVLANVFVAGVTYATPKFRGLQLSVGYYDPATLVGQYWTRTKFGRPEAEATYDLALGDLGKLHVFANGAYQKMYAADVPKSTDVYGAGGGARVELGPFHLGVAAHYGQGLGVSYFLNGSDAILAQNLSNELRKFDGAYVQTQLVVSKFDFNVGWGVTRVHQVTADIDPQYFDANTGQPAKSFLKSQMGISGVVVYHFSPFFHGALDYFRSDARWWLGEKQVVNSFNAGATLTW